MIFEIKNYQTCKQYKINGAVVPKSVFESAKNQEKEIKTLKAQIEDLATITTPMKAECMGEFKETYEVWNDLADDYIEESRVISWTNMKDIYAMMLAEKLKEGV